ncbi:MazG family protein [Geoalkalibacter sp.]|uniref:MazG family protein n=1 Tax=Geoalkalibacter sp. TaxID=3041440 RepID=UPI00272EC8B0|nr:MazG family protein [Geoalkalibacter sp.]
MPQSQNSSALLDLVDLMRRLRSPEGCPWDREQTARSLQPYLLEETYEVLEALDQAHPRAICEELGDLLLQVVFLAQIFAEQELFTIEDVARAITDKLIRRHPHVFAGTPFADMDELNRQWESIKNFEKTQDSRPASGAGAPLHLPALARAGKLLEPLTDDEEKHLPRTLDTILGEFSRQSQQGREERLTAALACLVSLGKRYGIDSEQALRRFLQRQEMPPAVKKIGGDDS